MPAQTWHNLTEQMPQKSWKQMEKTFCHWKPRLDGWVVLCFIARKKIQAQMKQLMWTKAIGCPLTTASNYLTMKSFLSSHNIPMKNLIQLKKSNDTEWRIAISEWAKALAVALQDVEQHRIQRRTASDRAAMGVKFLSRWFKIASSSRLTFLRQQKVIDFMHSNSEWSFLYMGKQLNVIVLNFISTYL